MALELPKVSVKWFYAAEVLSKVAVALLAICIYSFVAPFERTIAWADQDRVKPVLEESVPVWMAFTINGVIGGLYLIFLIISIWFNARLHQLKRSAVVHQVAKAVLSLTGAVVFTWAIVEPLKRFTSSPRPHFLARCYGGVEFVPPLDVLPTHITNAMCLQNYQDQGRSDEISEKYLNEDRLSFPSAHSAFTAAIFLWMGFYSYYLSFLLNVPGYSSVGSAMLVLLVCPLFFVATSRVRDLWHFPHDVLGGLVIGSFVAMWQYFAYFPILKGKTGAKAFFKQEETRQYETFTNQNSSSYVNPSSMIP